MKTALTAISGIETVILGGSRARRTHSPESDIDIGIYYDDEHGENLIVPSVRGANFFNLLTIIDYRSSM